MTKNKVIMGICIPIRLKEAIDKTRGDVPRSTYISKVLEQIYKKKEENGIQNVENRQSKSQCQPQQDSTDSKLPFADS